MLSYGWFTLISYGASYGVKLWPVLLCYIMSDVILLSYGSFYPTTQYKSGYVFGRGVR